MWLRLRQIALVAPELAPAVDDITGHDDAIGLPTLDVREHGL